MTWRSTIAEFSLPRFSDVFSLDAAAAVLFFGATSTRFATWTISSDLTVACLPLRVETIAAYGITRAADFDFDLRTLPLRATTTIRISASADASPHAYAGN